MNPLRATSGWLTAIALVAVAGMNLAGLWGIAVARQGALEEAHRAFDIDVSAKASALEARLAGVRSDLEFLGGSSTIERLEEGKADASAVQILRQAAESALLLFLRSHSEVVRIVVRSSAGRPLLHVGRRGGVPVLWVSAVPTGQEGAAVDPRRPRLTARLAHAGAGTGVTIETEIAPSPLLELGGATESRRCELRDAAGVVLGQFPPGPREVRAEPRVGARAQVRAEGWSAPGPFALACTQPERSALSLAEPVWARYRTTSALNLVAMALALLLGGFAVSLARRRAVLEARAAEEARVRELERQLFHAERLTTVGRLAAGIAHEINNPLEGMANYLTLAREALARGDGESATRHLAAVKQGLDRAAGTVRQVLAHADPAKAPKSPVDLNQVLLETERFVRSRKEFSHVAFELALCERPLVVHGNSVMLGQVAMNLIVNACEAQLGAGEVRIASRLADGRAVAVVADRGPGIADSDRQRVFEPFYSTKDSTGLGLWICHAIVRQHEGELSVRPREGGGTVFQMTLPVLPQVSAGSAEAEAAEERRP